MRVPELSQSSSSFSSGNIDRLVELADQAARSGRFADASQLYEAAADSDPSRRAAEARLAHTSTLCDKASVDKKLSLVCHLEGQSVQQEQAEPWHGDDPSKRMSSV
jgi:hypothetical protein